MKKATDITEASSERLFRLADSNAKAEWGRAWQLLGTRMQRAVVADHILRVAAGQDDHVVTAERVRSIVEHSSRRLSETYPST